MSQTPADGNEDGYTHLTYYHQPDLLSFVINELTFPIVNVCHGGYAEPVVTSFHLANYSPNTPGNFHNLTTHVFDFGVKAWLASDEYLAWAHGKYRWPGGGSVTANVTGRSEGEPVTAYTDDDLCGAEQVRCRCEPCPGRGNDGHGMTHCAECCFGTLVIAEPDCPVHGERARAEQVNP